MAGTDTAPERGALGRRRAWLLEGLSEQTARHPGPHGTPPAEHKGHGAAATRPAWLVRHVST
jgi:hypothetical protein